MQHKKPTTYLREQKMNLGVRGESFLKFSFFKRRKPSDLCLRGSKSSNFPLDTVPPKAAAWIRIGGSGGGDDDGRDDDDDNNNNIGVVVVAVPVAAEREEAATAAAAAAAADHDDDGHSS